MTGATDASEHRRAAAAQKAGPSASAEATPMRLGASPDPVMLEETLRGAARGDGEAWRRLIDGYSRRVYGLLVRQCGDRDLAEEITQGTFVKLVEKLADFEGYEERGRFEAWLFRVAMNGLRDEMRRRKRQAVGVGGKEQGQDPGLGLAQQPARDAPMEAASRAEEVERVRAAMAALGEADREVLHLRHTLGMSFAEIAATLEQPLGTVLARAHRALGKLRKRLETEELSESTHDAQRRTAERGKVSGR